MTKRRFLRGVYPEFAEGLRMTLIPSISAAQPGYFMNCCRETTKMGVPPGNRPAVPRDSEAYLNGTSQGPTPEDARKDGHIRGRSK